MRTQDTSSAIDRESSDRADRGSMPRWRRALSLSFTGAIVAVALFLWPAVLGGSTRLVVVSGHSMEPTYQLRDIVVARDSGGTEIGDVVVFEVPDGEAAGLLVIHRVVGVDDEGFFVTQGDNRTTPDQWKLTEEDIVGTPLALIPKGGMVLGFIQNVWVIALLVGVVALFVLWPDRDDELDEDAALLAQGATPDELAEAWLDAELGNRIDDDVMTDAMAWLDAQLAVVLDPARDEFATATVAR